MTRYILLSFSIFFLFNSCATSREMKKNVETLNILIVTDNRKFNREAFFAMFDSFENITWTEGRHPEVLDLFGTDSIRKYDAVVFYDMPETVVLTEKQKRDLRNYFEKSAPVLFLHHSILSYREWDLFPEILGGRYYGKTPHITENGDTIRSTYQHDVLHQVKIVDRKHPITRGVADFEIMDEVYNNYYVKEDVHLLLTTDHPESGRQLGWINRFGKSKIAFLINGHDEQAYKNENYRKLIQNALWWVSSENRN